MEARVGQITIPIDFTQFYTTLIHQGIVTPYAQVLNLYIPPNYTVKWGVKGPTDYVALLVEQVITVSPDHDLSIEVYSDGNLLYSDNDMTQAKYNYPINFPRRFGALIPATNRIDLVLTNKSSTDTVYFSLWYTFGSIKREYYENIYRQFFKVLAITLKLPPYE